MTPAKRRAQIRNLIAKVVKEINRGDDEGEAFWFIIAALRGPDSSFDPKGPTTGRIRHAIGINCDYLMTQPGQPEPVLERGGSRHFYTHVLQATEAIETLYGKRAWKRKEKTWG